LILRLLIISLLITSSIFAEVVPVSTLQKAIQEKFMEYYPALKIKHIDIKALSNNHNLEHFTLDKILIQGASLKRKRGTFSVLYRSDTKKKKKYYRFQLDATLGVYRSAHFLKRQTPLLSHNLNYEEVPFNNFSAMPISEQYFDLYESKRSIKEGKIITLNDVQKILDVKRGELVDATLRDESVVLNFKVKAIEDGSIGDIIKVKRGYYKKFRARILSTNQVEIVE
jgi:flagella basal body P-ring formation protein FlgA